MTETEQLTTFDLIKLRTKHGAGSAIGHRCSNLLQLLKNYNASDVRDVEHQNGLKEKMEYQMRDLKRLLSQ